MRTIAFIAALIITWAIFPTTGLDGIRDAHAVKPPTVKEREESVANPDQHKKAEWFGRESRTTGGTFCKCGVSKGDKAKCYYPEEGQICRNPETGETHIVSVTDWNNPVKAFEGR